MSLNIMIAGCSRDERDGIEASVKAAFGERAAAEPWNVSLVNVANQWSIEINGPDPRFNGLSLVAPATELTACLRQALGDAASAGVNEGAPGTQPPAETERNERHDCEECAASFEVLFSVRADEPTDLFPVACPHCWHVNKVPIGETAGSNGDYRAQAL